MSRNAVIIVICLVAAVASISFVGGKASKPKVVAANAAMISTANEPPEGAPLAPVGPLDSLVVEYAGLTPSDMSQYGVSKEASIRPGSELMPFIRVVNTGPEPITGLKFAIRPAGHFELAKWDDPNSIPAMRAKLQEPRLLQLLTTTGLPVTDIQTGKDTIFSENDKYHQPNKGFWGVAYAEPGGPTTYSPSYKDIHLTLSPKEVPGRDLQLSFVLCHQGKERVVSYTVHVMYPS